MHNDIIIIRDGDAYRLLHGHLRLSSMLHGNGETSVEIRGEGRVKVLKTGNGYRVGKDAQCLPLYA